MHEFSIALNIIEIAEEECLKSSATCVKEINLEIGNLSGVIQDALEFALSEAVKGSLLEDAEINYRIIQGRAQCDRCKNIFQVDQLYDMCPVCNDFKTTILEGKELQIKSLIVA